jgi:signal peptidase I
MQISQLEVLRDLHYLAAPLKPSEPRQLSSDEYFVLGDNSAISDDSRTWPETVRITDEALIGRVLGHR